MSLNLHALAMTVVRESASPDPDTMVANLVAQIDPTDYAEAITYLARDLIRATIRHQREALNGGPSAGPAGGSRKVQNAREAWKRLLNAPEFLPSSGQWIFLRDASHDQVMEMAGLRMQKSRELAAAAKQYRKIAEQMAAVGASTVGDLPDDTLESLLAPAAKAVKAA